MEIAVKFAEWIEKNNWQVHDRNIKVFEWKVYDPFVDRYKGYLTTEELFKEFQNESS